MTDLADVRAFLAEHDATPATGDEPARPTGLRFLTPAELLAEPTAHVDWIWRDYLARTTITLLLGKPKAGKSTLAFALAHAIANGEPFLGRPTHRTGVVYASEEGNATVAHKLDADNSHLHILTRQTAWPKPSWPEMIAACEQQAHAVGAGVLVVDTLAFWAGLGPDKEQDAGAAQAALELLQQAAANGLAVLLGHHARKSGGEDGDASRGSNAIPASADLVLELLRPEDRKPRQRVLVGIGRFPDTPGMMLIEHDAPTGTYRVVGEGADRHAARAISDREALLEHIPEQPPGVTRTELEELLDAGNVQWSRQLATLIEEGVVTRDGIGKKGDPYRYRKGAPQAPDAERAQKVRTDAGGGPSLSAAHPPRDAAEKKDPQESASGAESAGSPTPEEQALLDELATRHEELR